MSQLGHWVANCQPERVTRIVTASVYELVVGPPKPNQIQTMDDLLEQGLVGLYRTGRKDATRAREDQRRYLAESDFDPTPALLKGFFGPMGGDGDLSA
ncbi:hypothetical protein Deba_3116 [Desulfarculus baarsii DSM 2075]|uniref:Uncharacterized protein n=1 Tax=Desulfarculus baarsii (strain ATCC 33931 / DSM 2075 / LMG 7858 / VKM B-1802 / 2st14) TaxID=644282 RepID=E1QLN4_DESB2|nr:hypothetical protein [Desulfarculus baarsii]ADK86469.1 hypothetical protein Deba_3116 [Desulfarculus baarsii DSM 2075]